jgi:UDP:flavonoid glycosyltransferase YjiC (YdhE family)
MRVLVATTANDGHFGPLAPLARACLAAGHAVRVAAPASFADTVRAAGLEPAPFPDAPPELVGPVMGRLPELSFEEADSVVIRDVFGRIDAQAAFPGVAELVDTWRPDVVLREPAELGSLAAATRAGVPHAQLAIGMQEFLRTFDELTREPLAELSRLAGLPEDALGESRAAEPAFSSVPERLDRAGDDGYRADRVTERFAPLPEKPSPDMPAPGEPLPEWGDPELPLLYVTFGSVTGSLPPFAGLFAEALEELAGLPVRVLMTVGRGFDLDGLGKVPRNAHVVPWWPQADVLERASAVLGHGGFGTMMGAVGAGLPQVVAPVFSSDQVANGRHLAATGAGRTTPPGPDLVGRAVTELDKVLEDPLYAVTARDLAADVAALPGPASAVAALEALAGAGRASGVHLEM